jgi:MFS family permease
LSPQHGHAPTKTFHLKAVQGLGAGAITSSVQILLSDLVTLRERGTFSGLIAL